MNVVRLNTVFKADPKKVILQFFEMNEKRTRNVINRILLLSENRAKEILENVYSEFSKRHKNFDESVIDNYEKVEKYINNVVQLSKERKLLIGAYFSKEYSIESAALFNPSIVPHPNQEGVENGELKFIMSLRATGEGHISSIEFREGLISLNGDVEIINNSPFSLFGKKTSCEKEELITKNPNLNGFQTEKLSDLIESNYKCSFNDFSELSEHVLFPYSKSESMGMEDVRFVKFTDNGEWKYYGTYTAYNGRSFRTQLIETCDFKNFEIGTLSGDMVKDKGMALFPKKINGKYYITSRQDGENLYLMKSDNLYQWNESEKLLEPEKSWEFIQLGNCGSPIETEKGWLLITHAVGPFRKYVMSAVLLDLDNPEKVIGTLDQPLIQPNLSEREGYVPNVVYSCGSLIHKDNLIIPYAMSDSSCGFARVDVNELISKLC